MIEVRCWNGEVVRRLGETPEEALALWLEEHDPSPETTAAIARIDAALATVIC